MKQIQVASLSKKMSEYEITNLPPAILSVEHGPFVFGKNGYEAVRRSIVLEKVAEMAYATKMLNPSKEGVPLALREKHYYRKHGNGAYYGQ